MPKSGSFPVAPFLSPRKRVLVVNCYLDYSREPIRRPTKIPQAVGPIYLARAFATELCEVGCYNELSSGPLEDELSLTKPIFSGPLRIEAEVILDPASFPIDSQHLALLK